MTTTDVERAYLAGIIDGEGCISVAHRRVSGKSYITPTLQVTNTKYDLLEWLHTRYGGSIYPQKTRPTRKPCWVWSVAAKKALHAIREARPFLLLKGEQADIVLAIARYAPTSEPRTGRLAQRMTAVEFGANDNVVRQIRALNKRGI